MNKKNDSNLDKLFGSKSRVKLLELFYANSDKSFYVREITRLIDEQINSVRRELANLLSLGIVKSDTYDNKLYYAVNQDYLHFAAFKKIFSAKSDNSQDHDKTAQQPSTWDILTKPIKTLVELLIVIDDASSSSNIDMLIVGNDLDRKLSRWAGLVEKKQGRPLNYAILTHEDYYYRLSIKDKFLHDILAHNYVVVIDEGLLKDGEKNVRH